MSERKLGRPRKPIHEKKRLTKQETAELLRGVEVVQLDYYTGEYVGEYPSISSAELDHDIEPNSLVNAFTRIKCCMKYYHKFKLLFMRKTDFEMLYNNIKEM